MVTAFAFLIAAISAQTPPGSSELLRNADGASDAFSGVGQLRASATCTASLIDPSGSSASGAKAWLLTAGHCISLDAYGVIRNQPLNAQVQFNYFIDTPDRRVTVRTRSVAWSTMKGVDLALLELDTTLGDLTARGIRPQRLAAATPGAGRPVFWTGIPGFPIPTEFGYLRLGLCTLGARVQLLEGSWIWNDELSNDCPDLYAGASGSPVFDAASGEVIGVIGTTTLLNVEEGPDYDCQRDRPCAIGATGPVMQRNTSYASAVEGLAACFDQANGLDLARPGCPLDPGLQLTISAGAAEVPPVVAGKPSTWDAALSGTQRYYAYKTFRAGQDNCANPSGYAAPAPVASAPVIRDPIGSEDGYYFLCVVAGDTPAIDSSWQKFSHASERFKRLDSQPPVITVDYELEEILNAYRLVNMTGGGGTSGLGLATVKRGPPATTDCSDPRDYRIQLSVPETVRTADQPVRICWKYTDKAGNAADPAVFDFGAPALLPAAVRNSAGLQRGAIAPGSVFRVDTFNLTGVSEFSATPKEALAGVRMSVRDGAGRMLPVPMTTAGPLYLEAVMPDAASAGPATLIVQPPAGPPLSQPVGIRRSAPGLYFTPGAATPQGYAFDAAANVFPLATCTDHGACYLSRIPLSSARGGLDFVLYGTGIRGAAGGARIRLGTHIVEPVAIEADPGIAGLDRVRFHLAQDFPLHLYQTIAVETPDGTSNYRWIYLE